MGYISAQQAATKWGISKRRVQVLCTENRIKNATRIGNMWVVPEDALKPADGRVQTHHTVESPTARAARTALKKLTVNAYQEINGKLNKLWYNHDTLGWELVSALGEENRPTHVFDPCWNYGGRLLAE